MLALILIDFPYLYHVNYYVTSNNVFDFHINAIFNTLLSVIVGFSSLATINSLQRRTQEFEKGVKYQKLMCHNVAAD